jgi:O-methyltransferase
VNAEILSGGARAQDDKMVTNRFGRLINSALGPLGLRLTRASTLTELSERLAECGPLAENAQKHTVLVAEVEGLLRETLFPDLPPREGRAELLTRLYGTTVTEAIYLLEHLHKSLGYEGDVCEFGVAQGRTSALIANEIRDTDKNFWLFDSFEGLPEPTEKDELIDDIFGLKSIENYKGTMACPQDMVEANLSAVHFPRERVKIVPGFVPDTFERAELPSKVCFAYVDFDFYEPILVTLRFLDARLPVGGHVMVDDYGFFSSGAKTAVDEFVAEQGGAYEFSLPYKSAGKFCMLRKTR